MFINPISVTPMLSKNYNNNVAKTKNVHFSGKINPETEKNQLKILLCQDIWAEKLKVKLPETELEKETILEILQQRQKLDRYVRLTNERLRLDGQISYASRLLKENPSHPDLPQVLTEIKKYGNLDSTLKTMDKQINLEAKKNAPAIEYFKNIQKLEEEYSEKRLIKNSAFDKFWHKVQKNNININGQYSTKELIDIIANTEPTGTLAKTSKVKPQPTTKKQILSQIEKQYEQLLRESVDVYSGEAHHNKESENARQIINETNKETLKNFPDINKHLLKIYENIERKFIHKVDRLADTDIYPIGEIWKDMKNVEATMKKTMLEIDDLNSQLDETHENKKLQSLLSEKETKLEELKKDWIEGLNYSIKYESINRERMEDADRLSEYDYLTSENKTLKRHKKAFEILQNNDNTIPDELWPLILK